MAEPAMQGDCKDSSNSTIRRPWVHMLPLLILVLVLSVLYMDCRTAAGEVAIKLLDGTLVHNAAAMQSKAGPAADRADNSNTSSISGSPDDEYDIGVDPADVEEDPELNPQQQPAAVPASSVAAIKSGPVLPAVLQPAQAAKPPPAAQVPAAASAPAQAPAAAASLLPSPSPAPTAPAVVPDLSAYTDPVLPIVAKSVLELDKQKIGKRVISMSLFGTQMRYIEGAVDNAMLARRDWPGWTYRIYYGEGVPDEVLRILRAFGTELIHVNAKSERATSTLWRYYVSTDPTVSRFVARDVDARLSHRDNAAVDEWINSGLYFHTMHDHVAHTPPIMGGLFGAVGGFLNPQYMLSLINNSTGAEWGVDQDWLKVKLWPYVQNYTLDHSSYKCGDFHAADNRGFPTQREDDHDLVGNVHAPPDYRGITQNGPCPERCRRKPEWTNC